SQCPSMRDRLSQGRIAVSWNELKGAVRIGPQARAGAVVAAAHLETPLVGERADGVGEGKPVRAERLRAALSGLDRRELGVADRHGRPFDLRGVIVSIAAEVLEGVAEAACPVVETRLDVEIATRKEVFRGIEGHELVAVCRVAE